MFSLHVRIKSAKCIKYFVAISCCGMDESNTTLLLLQNTGYYTGIQRNSNTCDQTFKRVPKMS